MTKKLLEVGLKVGLSTGGVLRGMCDYAQGIKMNNPTQWDALRNDEGDRVFVCVSVDGLDAYLPQLSPVLDANEM
jgi:hypothetical protein